VLSDANLTTLKSQPDNIFLVLQVVCTEAAAAKATVVAKEALAQLYDRITAQDDQNYHSGQEAVVLRNLISITAGRQATCWHTAIRLATIVFDITNWESCNMTLLC